LPAVKEIEKTQRNEDKLFLQLFFNGRPLTIQNALENVIGICFENVSPQKEKQSIIAQADPLD